MGERARKVGALLKSVAVPPSARLGYATVGLLIIVVTATALQAVTPWEGATSRATSTHTPVVQSATTRPSAIPSPASPAQGAERVMEQAQLEPPPVAAPRVVEPFEHVVQEGDTLMGIASAYAISPDAIVWANDGVDDADFLSLGQVLIIPPVSGILHVVEEGDTLLAVAALYESEVEDIATANELGEPFLIAIGQMLVVPGGKPPAEPEPLPEVQLVAALTRAEPATRSDAERVATVVPQPGLDQMRIDFLASLIGPAQRSQRETGVPASVTIAQAIWEADWGRSGLAKKAHNYFGIKGRPTPGPAGVIWLETWEHINGKNITVREPFRAYNNLLESVLDHGVFLSKSTRYAEAMKNRDDPKTFIRLVHQAGYATDPAYSDKIIRLLDRYDLYVYDLL